MFGGGADSEYAKETQQARIKRQGLLIENRKVAQNSSVVIQQRHSYVAHCAESAQVRVLRKQLSDVLRDMDQLCFPDNRFARSAGNIVFVIGDPFTVKPKGERTQSV